MGFHQRHVAAATVVADRKAVVPAGRTELPVDRPALLVLRADRIVVRADRLAAPPAPQPADARLVAVVLGPGRWFDSPHPDLAVRSYSLEPAVVDPVVTRNRLSAAALTVHHFVGQER